MVASSRARTRRSRADPLRAREALRGLFENGRISVHPRPDGSYVVKGTFLPLVAVANGAPRTRRRATARTRDAFDSLENVVAVQMEILAPKPPDRRKKEEST